MRECQHIRITLEHNKKDVRAKCSCGKIVTNWHQDERKARTAFRQEREYRSMMYGYNGVF